MRQRAQRPLGPNDSRRPTSMRHGMHRAEIDRMLMDQGGRCAICRTADFGVVGPVVDHDHALARVHGHSKHRGCRRCVRFVTCQSCNTMLGAAKDDPHLLRVAADLLDAWLAHTARSA